MGSTKYFDFCKIYFKNGKALEIGKCSAIFNSAVIHFEEIRNEQNAHFIVMKDEILYAEYYEDNDKYIGGFEDI